jgi:hypothetical protein
MPKEKQKTLYPEIKEVKEDLIKNNPLDLLKNFQQNNLVDANKINNVNDNIIISPITNTAGDSMFMEIIKNLQGRDDIDIKTELVDDAEVFIMTKLDFIATITNCPYLTAFNKQFKLNRVSKERKSRQEIIMALVERQEEKERQMIELQRQQAKYNLI